MLTPERIKEIAEKEDARLNGLCDHPDYRRSLSPGRRDLRELMAGVSEAQRILTAANFVVVDLAELEAALKPFAVLKIPFKPQGNAGAYSLRFSDIERAAALLAALTQEMKA